MNLNVYIYEQVYKHVDYKVKTHSTVMHWAIPKHKQHTGGGGVAEKF